MSRLEDEIVRLVREIERLSEIVAAGQEKHRNVSLQKALIVEHSWALQRLMAGSARAENSEFTAAGGARAPIPTQLTDGYAGEPQRLTGAG